MGVTQSLEDLHQDPFRNAGCGMATRQQNRRRAIRWAFFITGLIFYAVLFLGPAIGGLITQ